MGIRLQDLKVGEQAKIVRLSNSEQSFRKKLLSMGLTPGTVLTVVRFAPLGDPVEVRVRGFSLSLRKNEAMALQMEQVA
jgi:ferrous iron transport protein A